MFADLPRRKRKKWMQEEIILVDRLLRGLLEKDQEAVKMMVGIEKESPIVRALCCGSLLAMAIYERKKEAQNE